MWVLGMRGWVRRKRDQTDVGWWATPLRPTTQGCSSKSRRFHREGIACVGGRRAPAGEGEGEGGWVRRAGGGKGPRGPGQRDHTRPQRGGWAGPRSHARAQQGCVWLEVEKGGVRMAALGIGKAKINEGGRVWATRQGDAGGTRTAPRPTQQGHGAACGQARARGGGHTTPGSRRDIYRRSPMAYVLEDFTNALCPRNVRTRSPGPTPIGHAHTAAWPEGVVEEGRSFVRKRRPKRGVENYTRERSE